jgi:hypothetical protein
MAGESSPVQTVSIPVTIIVDTTSAALSMATPPAQPVVAEIDTDVLDALLDGTRPSALLASKPRALVGRRTWMMEPR